MLQVKRLDGNPIGLMPAVDGHLAGRGSQLRSDYDVFLVPGDERPWRVRFQLPGALETHHRIVIAEDRDGCHRGAGGYWRRRQLHRRGGIDLVHHLWRRQRAAQGIGDTLRRIRRHRGEEIVAVGANGQVIRRDMERGGVGPDAGGVGDRHRRELAEKVRHIAGGNLGEDLLLALRQIHSCHTCSKLSATHGIGGAWWKVERLSV